MSQNVSLDLMAQTLQGILFSGEIVYKVHIHTNVGKERGNVPVKLPCVYALHPEISSSFPYFYVIRTSFF